MSQESLQEPVESRKSQDYVQRFFGGPPLAVIGRLILLSILVGVILAAIGLDPWNAEGRFRYQLGFCFCFKRGCRFIGFEIVGGLGITIVVSGQGCIDQAGNDGINIDAILTEL